MKLRILAALVSALAACAANAAWTYTVLHPASGIFDSYGRRGSGSMQAGYGTSGSAYNALMWSGTAGSVVNLHPAGATSSMAHSTDGSKQYGFATSTGLPRAGMWSGTAASFVNVTPAGMAPAELFDGNGGVQVGYVTSGGVPHASKWNGSAATWVDLHPSGYAESNAVAIDGGIQAGYAKAGTQTQAGIWSGSAASFVNLNPAGATGSGISCAKNGKQGGTAVFSGDTHGGYWSGSAASWVDLHPAGAQLSRVSGISDTMQVGDIIVGGYNRATLWTGTAASKVDLHATLPANYDYSLAFSVWSDGANAYILGYAHSKSPDRDEAILWTQASPDDFTFTLNKTQVAGQNSVQGTITMATTKATATTFTTYDNSSLVTTPASVVVPANTLVKNFQITVTAITSTINTTIYAKRGAITRSRPLALVPLIPTALSFTPSQVTGGSPTSCKVVVNGVAGPSGRVIAILDNSPFSTVPSTVTVPPGGTSVTFNIQTSAVTSQKVVTVTARVSAGEKTGTFRINP